MANEFQISDLVLYKNNQFIAFNKPAGIPVQSDKTGDKSLEQIAEGYVHHPLQLIHRLDRPATGVTLFAKNKGSLAAVNEQFRERKVQKTYLAVVKKHPPEKEGTLVHFMRKNGKTNRSHAFAEAKKDTKRAELSYKVIQSSDNYHLLEIELLTGRHHQIRAQLAAIECPIKGDVKYGARRNNRDRSISLHAWKLSFKHPISGQVEHIVAPAPEGDVWAGFDLSND